MTYRASLLALVLLCSAIACSHRGARPEAADAEAPGAIPEPESLPSLPPIIVEASPDAPTTTPSTLPANADPVAKIRDEGLNRSQVMQTLSYLTDVIGPRLTGSPNLRRANDWTQDRLKNWGLANAHQEPWGPFGRGWSLVRFSAQIVEPQAIPLIAYPKAWTPGLKNPITADVVHVDAKVEGDLAKYKGKLKGAVVLLGAARDLPARFEPLATRMTDPELLKLANADVGGAPAAGVPRAPADRRELLTATTGPTTRPGTRAAATSRASTAPAPPGSPRALAFQRYEWDFFANEGVAVVVTPSNQGDAGTFFVAQAFNPRQPPSQRRSSATQETTQPTTGPATSPVSTTQALDPTTQPVWSNTPPTILPQLTMASEHYNRLVRMIKLGERPRMTVDLQVRFNDDDLMAYNTVAEIPGTDLKDQVVMIGAHMDSWHSGTGATDNGAGVASVMEAVRILKACKLQPRRTIRIALWTGEEEGLFGSNAYVAKHFGKFEPTTQPTGAAPQGRRRPQPTLRPSTSTSPASAPTSRPARKLLREAEYEKLSVYFNLDNGTGKIRGVYLQGNEGVRPYFRKWLAPFDDLGAQTLTLSNTGGTDHLAFDAIGLPGFQFIQDPIDYFARTHHSNQDVYDRAQEADLKQASTIMAAFLYQAATIDEKLPRKPLRAE